MRALGRNAIFFCFDRAYRTPGLVAIMSVIRSMSACSATPDIVLFLPENELGYWRGLAEQLAGCAAYPALITLRADVKGIPLSAERYGFDAVRRLPRIAFGRLFATLELQRRGYAKALYLDADTIAIEDVTPLFSVNQKGFPFSALQERSTELIRLAIKAHKIGNGKYFNSGVMLFDLHHPELMTIIQAAIACIGNPRVHLYFHDQCALNRAVCGHFQPLPGKYNLFLFPGKKPPSNFDTHVIVHFIDSPKPWDAKHKGEGCLIWYQHWQRAANELCKLGVLPDAIEGPVLWSRKTSAWSLPTGAP